MPRELIGADLAVVLTMAVVVFMVLHHTDRRRWPPPTATRGSHPGGAGTSDIPRGFDIASVCSESSGSG